MSQLSLCSGLARFGNWRGQIEAVRILQKHRGFGWGQAMFDWATDQSWQRDCEIVQLTTSKSWRDTHQFDERLGLPRGL